MMDSFVLLADASLAASRTLFQWFLACLNCTLDSEDLFYWCKWKKWFLWTMATAQVAENHGNEWDLTWYLWWGIYTSEFRNILPQYFPHENHCMCYKKLPSRLWPVLFTLTYFFLIHKLSSSLCQAKGCCNFCFPQQIVYTMLVYIL